MSTAKAQFTGAAGVFHLARELALRGINAAVTVGNAPNVDLLASSLCGRRSLAFQVKTSKNAHRRNRYGREGHEWNVSENVIGKHNESFWYAFVDLRETAGPHYDPQVFFVPSKWVAEFVKADFSMFMYFLPATASHLCCEQWDRVKGYLEGDQEAIKWANSWPEQLLVKWGNVEPQATNA